MTTLKTNDESELARLALTRFALVVRHEPNTIGYGASRLELRICSSDEAVARRAVDLAESLCGAQGRVYTVKTRAKPDHRATFRSEDAAMLAGWMVRNNVLPAGYRARELQLASTWRDRMLPGVKASIAGEIKASKAESKGKALYPTE